jgi:hypothetical protein
LQWKNLYGALNEVALVFGVAKALQFLGVCAYAAGISFGSLNKYMTLNSLLGTRLAATVRTLGSAFMSLVRSPLAWFTMAALLVTEIGDAFINADRATKEFNKSLRDGAKTTYEDLKKFAEQYKNVRDSLYKSETIKDASGKQITDKSVKLGSGYTVTVEGKTFTIIKLGDANGDGKINSADLFNIVKHLKGTTLNAAFVKASDCNNDGKVNSADLLKIVKCLKSTDSITL